MSKKKKNSNYKGTPDTRGVPIKKKSEGAEDKKNYKKWIIISVCAVLILGIIGCIIGFSLPKKSVFVEIDFGDKYGKILIEVDRNAAPEIAEGFISLVKDGFYDGLTFFKAEKNLLIQGGEYQKILLKPIVGESEATNNKHFISHKRGVITAAITGDSEINQFSITLNDSTANSLDGKYVAFGYVVEGMDVVDRIAEDLLANSINDMGFVSERNAIEILSAKIVKR